MHYYFAVRFCDIFYYFMFSKLSFWDTNHFYNENKVSHFRKQVSFLNFFSLILLDKTLDTKMSKDKSWI